MRRAVLNLTLGIAVCTPVIGCGQDAFRADQAPSTRAQRSSSSEAGVFDRWSQDAYRYWAPELFFDDPNVIQLCKAIGEQDYEQIDRLVESDGVDVNATGRMNVTPLFWAFPWGYAEAFEKTPRDEKGEFAESDFAHTQTVYMGRHARLLEHLLKLGADPNIKTTRGNVEKTVKEEEYIIVPGHLFNLREGLAVTYLASQPIGPARFNYFPIVMANGGDPNLVGGDGATTIFFACGLSFGLGGRISPENVGILIDAAANLDVRDSKGNTPILTAANNWHFNLVYMLIHAGANFRAKNKRGQDVVSFARQRKRFIENMPDKYKDFFEKYPDSDIAQGTAVEIDPYFLEVVRFLEKEGMLLDGTHEQWKKEVDQVIEKCGETARGNRDPFVDEWVAKRRNAQEVTARAEVETITNSIGMKLVLIPSGEFMMGSPEGEKGRQEHEYQHRVRITKPFYLGMYEVTQEEYQRVMGKNPSTFKDSGPRSPVEGVSWPDAQEFCRKLSEMAEEEAAGRRYRLPTEAEWEYACRAGSTSMYHYGDDESRHGDYAWHSGNSDDRTHQVGQKKPNAWGLYDMHGNVWERCADWYDRSYYENSPVADPLGPATGTHRVRRGGSWDYPPRSYRSASRYVSSVWGQTDDLGFRAVLNPVDDSRR